MNILFVSKNLASIFLADRLSRGGHFVKMHEKDTVWINKIKRPSVEFVLDWKKELNWVGKDGLIVFDHIGMGKTQDQLRKEGFSVFGGCELGEKLEDDRQYGHVIFFAAGMKTKEVFDFCDIDKLVAFIKKIQENGLLSKTDLWIKDYATLGI